MTQASDKEDEQWLSALAGRSDPAADPAINLQAETLRRALQAQSAKLEQAVPVADEAQYQRLLFRLREEGLLGADHQRRKIQLWALAATVVLGVGVVVQMGGLYRGQDDEANTLRGGGKATVLLVENPEVRLTELLTGLKAAGEEPWVKRESDGRIMLTVKRSDKVLDYLATQRIEPVVTDGSITLLLTRPKP